MSLSNDLNEAQLLLELTNDARLNPLGDAARLRCEKLFALDAHVGAIVEQYRSALLPRVAGISA